MKSLIFVMIVLLGVSAQAFTFLHIGRRVQGIQVENKRDAQSVTDVMSQGSNLANVLAEVEGELQRVDAHDQHRAADVSTVLDLLRAQRSDVVIGEGQITDSGDKATIPTLNLSGQSSQVSISQQQWDEITSGIAELQAENELLRQQIDAPEEE